MAARTIIVLCALALAIVVAIELFDPPLTVKVGDFPIIEGPAPASSFLQMAPGGSIDIQVSHQRAVIGHDISIRVSTSGGRTISSVTLYFDQRKIEHQVLRPPKIGHARDLKQVGGYSPGFTHTLRVVVRGNGPKAEYSFTWTDP
jgi:hypothetical protein